MLTIKKVVADLWQARGRALLVVLAIATGLFAVVCVAATNAILTRELRRSFAAITPASATIRTSNVTRATLDSVAHIQGVHLVDGGQLLGARAQAGEVRKPIVLFSTADLSNIAINKLRPLSGVWPPPTGVVVLERAAVRVAGTKDGDSISIRVGRNAPVSLVVNGTLHDFSQAPAWQEGMIYGYVNRETMSMLSGDSTLGDVRIVADSATNMASIREVAMRVARALEANGHVVRDVQIPRPGEHPHQAQMNSLLGIQQAFGVVTLLLSAALIIVLLTALLVQHKRQIGAMKAIGASQSRIIGMYSLWIVSLAVIAEVVAIPLGLLAGRAYAAFIANMLNFDILNQSVPFSVLLTLVVVGCLIPLCVSIMPILRAARMTARAALAEHAPLSGWPLKLGQSRLLHSQSGRMAAIGLANSVRMRGRFALTVMTLAVGGALFLAALNLGRSFTKSLAVSFGRMGFDIALDVNGDVPIDSLTNILRAMPGIVSSDITTRMRAAISGHSEVMGVAQTLHGTSDLDAFAFAGTNSISLPPRLDLIAGRWLQASDDHTVVANHLWLLEHAQYKIGDSLTLSFGTDSSRWLLVGDVKEVFTGAQLYASNRAVNALAHDRPHNTQVQIVTDAHDNQSIAKVLKAIEQTLVAQGIAIRRLDGLQNMRQAREDHILVIVSSLVIVAVLSLIVGGLGLATMLSVAVFERSQEIGVMRAIGATRKQLLVMIVVEGAWIALAGWITSIVIAFPASALLNDRFGKMFLGTALEFHLSPTAIPWLALVTALIALAASTAPALRASEANTRELLVSV